MKTHMQNQTFSLRSRMRSIGYAINGVGRFFREEPNAWLHLCATILVALALVFLEFSTGQKLALIIVTGFVWVAEVFNTAVERMMDFHAPGYDPAVGAIKDIAAGAVLLASLTSVLVAAVIFIPKIKMLCSVYFS